jgi:hypothetical protein
LHQWMFTTHWWQPGAPLSGRMLRSIPASAAAQFLQVLKSV